MKDKRANSTAPATPNNVTAHGATQQTPKASARALKPTAPPVTPRILGVTGGAVGLSALALAFGVCCVAPWAVTLLGVAGAVLLARLSFIQPYVVAGTIVLLGIGFWFVYRRPRPDAACNVTQ